MEDVNFEFISADSPITLNFKNKIINEIDKDYSKETINLINYLSSKKEVIRLFERDDINYWQFIPSYIHVAIKTSLKISDLLSKVNISMTPEKVLKHCIEKGIFMGSMQKIWVGDLDFIKNLLMRKLSRIFLFQNKIKEVDTLFITQPKNWQNGKDIEFSGMIEYFKKYNKNSCVVESPYYADRLGDPRLSNIRKLRSDRYSNVIFYDSFEKLNCLFASVKERFSKKKLINIKVSNNNYLNFFINKILRWSINVILPYEIIFIQKTADNILEQIKCKNICVSYEHGPYSRAIVVSGIKKKKGLLVLFMVQCYMN